MVAITYSAQLTDIKVEMEQLASHTACYLGTDAIHRLHVECNSSHQVQFCWKGRMFLS